MIWDLVRGGGFDFGFSKYRLKTISYKIEKENRNIN